MKAYINTSTGEINTSDNVRGCMLISGQWDELKIKKVYYIVRATAGCFGCTGTTERIGYYKSKASAQQAIKGLNTDRVIHWIDFDFIA